eukprot:2838532-Pyramimonas_sp.AAC.1
MMFTAPKGACAGICLSGPRGGVRSLSKPIALLKLPLEKLSGDCCQLVAKFSGVLFRSFQHRLVACHVHVAPPAFRRAPWILPSSPLRK